MKRATLEAVIILGFLVNLAATAKAGELHLKYEVTETTTPRPGQAKQASTQTSQPRGESDDKTCSIRILTKYPVPPPVITSRTTSTTTMTVGLGREYFFVENDGGRVVYDFRTRRKLTLDRQKSMYCNDSLFSKIEHCFWELQNRIFINHMFLEAVSQSDKGKPRQFKPETLFDLETIFGLELSRITDPKVLEIAGKLEKAKVKTVSQDSTQVFQYKGQTVVRFAPSKHVMDPGRKRMFSRFLVYCCFIHPEIRRQIGQFDKIPQELFFRTNDMGEIGEITYRLVSLKEGDADGSKVPEGFKRAADPRDTECVELEKVLHKCESNEAPTRQAAVEFARKAAKEKNYLDAFLSLLEYSLQSDDSLAEEMRRFMPQAEADEQCKLYFSTMKRAASKEEVKQQLKSLEAIDRKRLKKAYVLDIFRANMKISIGQRAPAKKLFLAVLQANPFIAGVYKDLGRLYRSAYRMDLAWRCWDTARQLYPNHSMLREINQLEEHSRKTFPEHF